jgi:hypothetical protein
MGEGRQDDDGEYTNDDDDEDATTTSSFDKNHDRGDHSQESENHLSPSTPDTIRETQKIYSRKSSELDQLDEFRRKKV